MLLLRDEHVWLVLEGSCLLYLWRDCRIQVQAEQLVVVVRQPVEQVEEVVLVESVDLQTFGC